MSFCILSPLCIFQLGPTLTLAVVIAAGPGFIGTFIVAVKRFNEEKEEDDKRLAEEERRAEKEKESQGIGPAMFRDE